MRVYICMYVCVYAEALYILVQFKLIRKVVQCLTAGLLKLWVVTWNPPMGHENAICKNIIMIMTSVSLPKNNTGPLYDYFTRVTSNLFKIKRCY